MCFRNKLHRIPSQFVLLELGGVHLDLDAVRLDDALAVLADADGGRGEGVDAAEEEQVGALVGLPHRRLDVRRAVAAVAAQRHRDDGRAADLDGALRVHRRPVPVVRVAGDRVCKNKMKSCTLSMNYMGRGIRDTFYKPY